MHPPKPTIETVTQHQKSVSGKTGSRAPWLGLICVGLAVLVLLDNFGGAPDKEKSGPRIAASSLEPQDGGLFLPSATEVKVSSEPNNASLTINKLALIKPAQLHDTLSRPLFVRSRTAYRPPPPPAPVSQVVVKPPPAPRQPPPYLVTGIVLGGQSRIALLHPKSGAADVSVKQGDTVGQWHVKTVHSDAVTLTDGVTTRKLDVFPGHKTKFSPAAIYRMNRREPTRRWRRDNR